MRVDLASMIGAALRHTFNEYELEVDVGDAVLDKLVRHTRTTLNRCSGGDVSKEAE